MKQVKDWTEQEINKFLTLYVKNYIPMYIWHETKITVIEERYVVCTCGAIFEIDDIERHFERMNQNFFEQHTFIEVLKPLMEKVMEKEKVELWEEYLRFVTKEHVWDCNTYSVMRYVDLLNKWLNPYNFVEFLLLNKVTKKWGRVECSKCDGTQKNYEPTPHALCQQCGGKGKVKHPALEYAENLKEGE